MRKTNLTEEEIDRQRWEAGYRKRWPRAVLAFDRELAACEAVTEALARQALQPGADEAGAVETAEKTLARARHAYLAACSKDEDDWKRRRAKPCPVRPEKGDSNANT